MTLRVINQKRLGGLVKPGDPIKDKAGVIWVLDHAVSPTTTGRDGVIVVRLPDGSIPIEFNAGRAFGLTVVEE